MLFFVRRTTTGAGPATAPPQKKSQGDSYFNVTGYPFPLGPITRRRTIRTEVNNNNKTFDKYKLNQKSRASIFFQNHHSQIERGSIWTFEQPQTLGFTNVTTNCRMTVIKLASGGLWVHAPIAPTPDCLHLLKELDAPVEYIILPTFAYEHKIFVGPFSRKFPRAKVYITPKYVDSLFHCCKEDGETIIIKKTSLLTLVFFFLTDSCHLQAMELAN